MDYQEAIDRLSNHANSAGNGLQPEASFLWAIRQTDQTWKPQKFQPFYEDILTCLATVSLVLNGPVPSESVASGDRSIDRHLCYSISGILAGGWSHHFRWSQQGSFGSEYLREFASMMVQIQIAWDLVLAGDIDDIQADTELNYVASQS